MSVMLELKGVNKSFGGVQAVKDMSFVIEKGELTGLSAPTAQARLQYSTLLPVFMTLQAER